VLSNQPQGGFITRRPSTEDLIASDARYDGGFGFFQRNWQSQNGFPRNWNSQPGYSRR